MSHLENHPKRLNKVNGKLLVMIGVGGPGGWKIQDEPELHLGELGEDILVTDFAGWRSGKISDPENAAYYTTVPDCVCEILSPSTRSLDRGSKRDVYAREGVASVVARPRRAHVGGFHSRVVEH